MKILLPILLLVSTASFSQSADFVQVRKKGKVVITFYSGGEIAFTSESGSYINAHINGIKNDTL